MRICSPFTKFHGNPRYETVYSSEFYFSLVWLDTHQFLGSKRHLTAADKIAATRMAANCGVQIADLFYTRVRNFWLVAPTGCARQSSPRAYLFT